MIKLRSLFDRLWDATHIADLGEGRHLIHVDRHLLHELSSPQAFTALQTRQLQIRNPELAFAVVDHVVSTAPGRSDESIPGGAVMIQTMRNNAHAANIRFADLQDDDQGIVHIAAAEQGIVGPGMTIVCGDSHTCTLGALGSWAFGIGTSDVAHVLATQALVVTRPRSYRVKIEGTLSHHVSAKDVVLALIGKIGVNFAKGGVVEFAGPVIDRLSMEGRFTLCNMGVEAGARSSLIAPDSKTLAYVESRHTPNSPIDDHTLDQWRALRSSEGCAFDGEYSFDATGLTPQITWGTNPGQVVSVSGSVPDPAEMMSAEQRASAEQALAYMGLAPKQPMHTLEVNNVFIGSCTNGRLEDLEAAAAVARLGHVAPGVKAIVVPGSRQIKRAAERRGLDRIFRAAGFEWRESGCSMCVAMNGDEVRPGDRTVSTSNRNFEGRQGHNVRTHLASPATAVASALTGHIAAASYLEARP